jgi:outer membrane lipopolysaccharide assembly protein LptE/RlpB
MRVTTQSWMKRSLTLILIAILATALTACGGSTRGKSRSKKDPKNPAEQTEKTAPAATKEKKGFFVVQVNGDSRIVTWSELETIRSELKSKQKDALAAYKNAKMEAEKSGVKFDQPRPAKPKLRVSRQTFATREEAVSHQEKMNAPRKAPATKKTAKPKPKPTSEIEGDPEEENPEGGSAEEGNPEKN